MLNRALTVGLAALLFAFPQEAGAQGRGRPKPPQSTVQPSAPAPASTSAVTANGTRSSVPALGQFGSWLDDATVSQAGGASTGIGIGYWRTPGGSQIDVPILDVAYSLTNRVQMGATVPFYRRATRAPPRAVWTTCM